MSDDFSVGYISRSVVLMFSGSMSRRLSRFEVSGKSWLFLLTPYRLKTRSIIIRSSCYYDVKVFYPIINLSLPILISHSIPFVVIYYYYHKAWETLTTQSFHTSRSAVRLSQVCIWYTKSSALDELLRFSIMTKLKVKWAPGLVEFP